MATLRQWLMVGNFQTFWQRNATFSNASIYYLRIFLEKIRRQIMFFEKIFVTKYNNNNPSVHWCFPVSYVTLRLILGGMLKTKRVYAVL